MLCPSGNVLHCHTRCDDVTLTPKSHQFYAQCGAKQRLCLSYRSVATSTTAMPPSLCDRPPPSNHSLILSDTPSSGLSELSSLSGQSEPPPLLRPHTSASNAPPPLSQSSLVGRVAIFFAEHKRDQVQAFGDDTEIHQLESFKTSEEFIEFLQAPQDILELAASNLSIFAFQNFVEAANSVATSIGGRHELLPPYFASPS